MGDSGRVEEVGGRVRKPALTRAQKRAFLHVETRPAVHEDEETRPGLPGGVDDGRPGDDD